ncbi:MAG: right-handed parallel beta-helix repeat-containing protein, partial [Anaerolineae bacterium]|nr:right-handed parallel beta-helix repeat-containing protein [Anaerolineae bacterium]
MPTIVAGSNTDAIVAAINAAKSGDRIVHFPTGEYQVTRPIEELANSEGISLTGDKGKSIVHVLTSSSEYGFLVGGARNLTFRNLTFATVNGRSAAQGAFIGREASGGARSCSYVRIFSCEFYQFKQAPWILSAGSEYLWCVGNFIHNISAPGGGSGLSLSNVSHAVYVRNRIEDISSPNSGSHAMNLDGDGVTDVLVLDNSIDGENGPDYGIAITSAVVGCTIDNNQIAGCPSPFVIRDTDADELVVENNSVVLAHGSTAVQVGGTAGRHGNGTGRAVIGNNSVHLPPNAIQGSSIKLVRVESTPMTVLVHHNSIPFGSYLSQLTTGAAQIGPGTLFLD